MDVNGISENLVGNASVPIYHCNLGLGFIKKETQIVSSKRYVIIHLKYATSFF